MPKKEKSELKKSAPKPHVEEKPLDYENLDDFMCSCKMEKGIKLFDLLRSWFENKSTQIDFSVDPVEAWDTLPNNVKLAFVMTANNKFKSE